MLHARACSTDDELARMLAALDELDGRRRRRRLPARAPDEDVHTALERGLLERVGPDLGGKLRAAARGTTRWRPCPDVPARPRPHDRRGWSDSSRALARSGGARTRTQRCPAERTSSTPSRCCSRTTCWRTCWPWSGTSSGCRDWDRRAAVSPYGSGALAGSSLGLDPEAVAADLGFDAAVAELDRRHGLPRLRGRVRVRPAMIGGEPLPDRRRGHRLDHEGVRLRRRSTTRSRPDRRSCRRRRTRTSPSWRGARRAG